LATTVVAVAAIIRMVALLRGPGGRQSRTWTTFAAGETRASASTIPARIELA